MDPAKQRRVDAGNDIDLKWLRSFVVVATHSTFPASLLILLAIVLLAAGYFTGREYVSIRRYNRRKWK
jgi:hypothetical protein